MKRQIHIRSILIFVAATCFLASSSMADPAGHDVSEPQYTVIDLGTLGGPGAGSNAFGINAVGWAAGWSNLVANGPVHAFLWFGGSRLFDLGTLGGQNSQANGLNDLGETAAGSETSDTDPNNEDFCGYGTHHQCLGAIGTFWGLTALQPLAGGHNANAFDVNDLGQVVGVAEKGTGDKTCASGMAFQVLRFEAVRWGLDRGPQELRPLPSDTVGFATGINSKGQAVGASGLCSNTIYQSPFGPFAPHAVMWDSDGSPTDLGHWRVRRRAFITLLPVSMTAGT